MKIDLCLLLTTIADRVMLNGKLITMDLAEPVKQTAISVRDNWFLHMGNSEHVKEI